MSVKKAKTKVEKVIEKRENLILVTEDSILYTRGGEFLAEIPGQTEVDLLEITACGIKLDDGKTYTMARIKFDGIEGYVNQNNLIW